MTILMELRDMARGLAKRTPIPRVREVYFPPWFEGGQPASGSHGTFLAPSSVTAEHEFMVMLLEGGAGGLSYLLLPPEVAAAYRALRPEDYVGTSPEDHLPSLGKGDPVDDMIGLAAVNAISQHVMRTGKVRLDHATDSFGLINLRDGDRVGMVGLFKPLLKYTDKARFDLVVIERDESLIAQNPAVDITLDVTQLRRCNKVLCTSTAVLNETIDEVLANCRSAEHVSVIGPSAGFPPDPLFARGVDVVGGRYVVDGEKLLARMKGEERWGDATEKLCFQKKTYVSLSLHSS